MRVTSLLGEHEVYVHIYRDVCICLYIYICIFMYICMWNAGAYIYKYIHKGSICMIEYRTCTYVLSVHVLV